MNSVTVFYFIVSVMRYWFSSICAADTRNTRGERVAFNQTSIFVQHAGGFGGKRTSDKTILPISAPQRPPDVSVHEKTSIDQVSNYCPH